MKKQVRLGAPRKPPNLILRFGEPLPQPTDVGNLAIVEFVGEEQRRITKLIRFNSVEVVVISVRYSNVYKVANLMLI